ncbi:M61 family metallopeptidase [Caenibius tardaugens]|nr:M61 family metallopeptidase [Caenibius tardaugens]AZI36968.1 peptidase M61 [Caenibius tardaugens NBRC 16725]
MREMAAIHLDVDASDTDHGIFRVVQTFHLQDVTPLTLTLAKWLPAYHAPHGAMDCLAGFAFTADGQPCRWSRDPRDPYRLHIDAPHDAQVLRAGFQSVTPTEAWQGRVVVSDDILRLDWEAVCLYPAGVSVDHLFVRPTLRLPQDWVWATALDAVQDHDGEIAFAPVNVRRLLDSPVMAGRHAHTEKLDAAVTLNIAADRSDQLPQDASVLEAHRQLVHEADAVFGHRPFARYDFLVSLSDQVSPMGLEHRASSECGVSATYFSNWDITTTEHDLLPHEYVHAWIGKYRVPQGNLQNDFSFMTDELMWVYEGLTQFYGYVLAARSGLISQAHVREALALVFATYNSRPGRQWRPLSDTEMDPIISGRQPKPWISWQRSEDYYGEGALVWLEIDAMLRDGTAGTSSLDDFCRRFFSPPEGGELYPPPVPYVRADVIDALHAILPYPWDAHLAERIDNIAPKAPYRGITLGGYELVWQHAPTDWLSHDQLYHQYFNFTYSLGMTVGIGAKIIDVVWDGPAFRAGLVSGIEILAVGNRAYSTAALQDAIDQAQTDGQPIAMTVRRFDRVKQVHLAWAGGQRYPTLAPSTMSGSRHLDALLTPHAKAGNRHV